MVMQANNFNQSGKNTAPNKGFTIHFTGANGETYIGHLVISEKASSEAMVKQLQDPVNMKIVLAAAELRPFKEKVDQDSSDLDALLAGSVAQEAAAVNK